MDYKKLYMKYKNKYLNLKYNLRGGTAVKVEFIGNFIKPDYFEGDIIYNNIVYEDNKFNGFWILGDDDIANNGGRTIYYSYIPKDDTVNNISHFLFMPDELQQNIWKPDDDKQKTTGMIEILPVENIIAHITTLIFEKVNQSFLSTSVFFENERNPNKLTINLVIGDVFFKTVLTNDRDVINITISDAEIIIEKKEANILLFNLLIILIYKKIITLSEDDITKIKEIMDFYPDIIKNFIPCVIKIAE